MSRPIAVAYRPILKGNLVTGCDMLTAEYHSPVDEKEVKNDREFPFFLETFKTFAQQSIKGDDYFIGFFNPPHSKAIDSPKRYWNIDDMEEDDPKFAEQQRLLPLYAAAWEKAIKKLECRLKCFNDRNDQDVKIWINMTGSAGGHGGGKQRRPRDTVRKGPRGGKYVIRNGRKVYV
jgi:hypothetical protein